MHVKKTVRLVVLFTLVLRVASAQEQVLQLLDATIEQARTAWNVPGLSVAVVRNDSVIFLKGYGVREIGKPDRVDEHTLFAIASNTKAFTAALIASLVDEEKLSWNDRVTAYLPYFQLYDPYVTADVRVRDLLSHRVGLGTFSGDLIWYGTPYSREEVVRRARFLKQRFPFRAGYGYSNIMYIAAGEVIEKVAGKRWEDVLRERILDPLDMTETVLSVNELPTRDNVATPHGEGAGKVRPYPWYAWESTVPAGGIITSATDIARWVRLVLRRGEWAGTRIYSDAQSRMMWTPHATFTVSQRGRERNPFTNFSGYGLGWSLQDYHGDLMVSHGGGYDGMFSQTVLLPDKGIGVVVLTNSMTGISGALCMTIVDALTGVTGRQWIEEGIKADRDAKERDRASALRTDSLRVRGTRPSFSLDAYAGTYESEMYGNATVEFEKGKLVLRLLPNVDMEADLSHWHYDVFELTWRKAFPWFGKGRVQFQTDHNAAIVGLKLDVPNHDFWFDEPEFKRKK